jgi:hypothetical protein
MFIILEIICVVGAFAFTLGTLTFIYDVLLRKRK